MMKSTQRGQGVLRLLFAIVLIFGTIYVLQSDCMPAEPKDVQAVAALAETSPAAKAAVVSALEKTPNPDRGELRRLRKRVDEILVTEASRKLTGNMGLHTPSEAAALRDKQEAALLARTESKSWNELTEDEQAAYVVDKSLWGLFFIIWLGLIPVMLRAVTRGSSRH